MSQANSTTATDVRNEMLADMLKGDPESVKLPGQKYLVLSIVGPTCLQKTKENGIKFRGAFASLEDANAHISRLETVDPFFSNFTAEAGEWLLIPPPLDKLNDQVYRDSRLNAIMQRHVKSQEEATEYFNWRKSQLQQGLIKPEDEANLRLQHPAERNVNTQ
eukprot:jgi/Astpho2/5727/fgenesh1_pg.00080_%23_5_t